jgi:hypothetical protein
MAVVMTGCATSSSYTAPTGSNTTLMAGWEQHFTLEWTAAPEPGGAQEVTGYIYNRHGERAMKIRLLVQALDPAGAVVGQGRIWARGHFCGSVLTRSSVGGWDIRCWGARSDAVEVHLVRTCQLARSTLSAVRRVHT